MGGGKEAGMTHDDAMSDARDVMEVYGIIPLWPLAEVVASKTRLTQDEAEDAIRELLTEWVAARIEEAGK